MSTRDYFAGRYAAQEARKTMSGGVEATRGVTAGTSLSAVTQGPLNDAQSPALGVSVSTQGRSVRIGQAGIEPGPLTLPWPPTGNTAVRHTAEGHFLRQDVIAYRDSVAGLLHGRPRIAGRYRLHVHLSPPDGRERDIDNCLKSLFDAMVRAEYLPTDSMTHMRELLVTVDDARSNHVRVRVMPVLEAA